MKSVSLLIEDAAAKSHPSRGAWIEIYVCFFTDRHTHGRTPRGVRGLKLDLYDYLGDKDMSHPSRGAWIEIRHISRMPMTL